MNSFMRTFDGHRQSRSSPAAVVGLVLALGFWSSEGAPDTQDDYLGRTDAEPMQYTAEGIADTVWYNHIGGIIEADTFSFRVTVDRCSWRIRFVPERGIEDYREVSSDGDQVYYLTMIESAVQEAIASGREMADNIAGGFVQAGAVPNLAVYNPTGHLWLAYASRCFFEGLQTNRIVPFAGRGTPSEEAFLQVTRRTDWALSANEPRLPRTLTIWEEPDDLDGDGRAGTHPFPFAGGFTNTNFRVLEITNVNGVELPLVAEAHTFGLGPGSKSTNDPWIQRFCRIVTTNVTGRVEALLFPPPLPGITTISEARFVGQGKDSRVQFAYRAENRFLTRDEVQRSAAYARARKPLDLGHERSSTAVSLLVVMILLAPAVFFGIRAATASRRQVSELHNQSAIAKDTE